MASQRGSSVSECIQHRDAVATIAQIDMDNLRHEVRVTQEEEIFMRREIRASSSDTEEQDDQLSHTKELFQDLVVQRNARSNVKTTLPIGQAYVEPTASSLPLVERDFPQEAGGDQETLLQKPIPATNNSVCDVLDTSNFRSEATSNLSHFQRDTTGEESVSSPHPRRNFSQCGKKGQGKRKPKS